MPAVSRQDIVDGYEDILLAMVYQAGTIGRVERMVADTNDEEQVRTIYDDVAANPQRALWEIVPRGATGRTASQGRYEVRRDREIVVRGTKAFALDPTTYLHIAQATEDASELFDAVHFELLRHSNIDAGTGELGVQVAQVDMAFDPERTVTRGGWHCFEALYTARLINQIEETT